MYEIITHGGGEVLWNAFNSIALLFQKSGVMGSLLYIAFNLAVIVATTQMVITQDSIKAFKWAFLSLFVVNALMLPKVNVIIVDRAALYDKKVDNVPFVLGFAASFTSKMGEFLAKKFDEVFAPPGLEYSSSGIAMASKLVSKTAYMTIQNPDVAENYKEFVRNCLMIDLVRGKYTANEFYNAEDTWEFLAKTSSPIRGFPYKDALGQTKIMTCREVAAKEQDYWKYHIKSAGMYFGFNVLQSSKEPLAALMTFVPISYEYLTGISQDASLTLRQAIMRNLIRDSVTSINASNPEGAELAREIAATRAQEQQKNTYALHGDTASLSLSTLKVLFEVLVYAMFPIAATLVLFPGGLRIAKEYFIMMFSIQMWAPMYAVLNMVLNVMARHKSMAAVTVIGTNGEISRVISYGTLPKLAEANEWIASVAGYGMGLIPFLAYGLFRYGAGALTQISSHFGSVSQSALGSAADMKTTGNMGLGNRTFDVHSQSNVSAMKYDTNLSIAAGKTTLQELDGSLLHQMADGQYSYDTSAVMPKLNSSIRMSDSLATAFNESANNSIQAAYQQSQSATENTTAAFNALNEFRQSKSSDTSNAETYNRQEMTLKETAFGQFDDLVTRFAEDNKIDKSKANQILTEASAGASIPGIASVRGSISGSRTRSDSELFSKAQDYSNKYGMSEMLRQSVQEAKDGRLSFLNSENNSYGDVISASLGKADSNTHSAQASLNKADYYQQQASHIKQSGISIDQDLTKQYWDSLVGGYGIDKAKEIVSDPIANYDHVQQFSKAKRDQLVHQFENQRPTNPFMVEQQYKFDQTQMIDNNPVETISNNNKEQVLAKRNEAKLYKPVETVLQDELNKNIDATSKQLEQHRENVNKEGLNFKRNIQTKIDTNMNDREEGESIYTQID